MILSERRPRRKRALRTALPLLATQSGPVPAVHHEFPRENPTKCSTMTRSLGTSGRVKIAVVGSGYVGLVAGACFADSGTSVVCIDMDEAKLITLRAGEVPFFEPRLADLLKRNRPHRLDFTSNLADGIRGREGRVRSRRYATSRRRLGRSHVRAHGRRAGGTRRRARHRTLVLKSTVPVGTGEKVRAVVRALCPEAQDQRRQ